MASCINDIKFDIIDEVRNKLEGQGLISTSKETMEVIDHKKAIPAISRINSEFKEEVAKISTVSNRSVLISPSKELVNAYYDEYTKNQNELEFEARKQEEIDRGVSYNKSDEDAYYQKENNQQSKANEETIGKVKSLLSKWGVNTKKLSEYAQETGIDVDDVNGIADLARKVVALADGKESEAITEEAIHIATAILEQTNPVLVTEMISKISRFSIYKRTLDEYKDDPAYQKDGKPDIRKIKKEAVDKLLAEVFINNSEDTIKNPELLKEENQTLLQSWWNKILDWFRGQYRKSNISIFGEVANIIKNDNIGNVSDIKSSDVFKQLSDKDKDVVAKLEATDKLLSKEYKDESKDDVLGTEEEANNWYVRLIDGEWKRIQHRVTDKVKEYYDRIFRDKTFTPEEKAKNEAKRNLGILIHNTIEGIVNRYVDPITHKLRDVILPKPSSSGIRYDSKFEVYNKLEKYVAETLSQFDKDSLIFPEKMILNTKYKARDKNFADGQAGTLDLLVLEPTPKGYKASILDWKGMGNKENERDVASYKQGGFNIQLETYKSILKSEYGIDIFGKTRAIPIMMDIGKGPDGGFYLKGIGIGSADTSKIEELKLLPIPAESERTGDKNLDNILNRLDNAYNKINDEKVPEEQRMEKRERLTSLRAAIRIIQTQRDLAPLKDAMEIYADQLSSILDRYNTDKLNIDKLSREERDEIANEFLDLSELKGYYSNIIAELQGTLIEGTEIYKEIQAEQNKINNLEYNFNQAKKKFAESIAENKGITGFLSAQRVIRGLYKMFKSFDEYSNKSARLIVTLYNEAMSDAVSKSTEFNSNLFEYIKEINSKGLSYSKIMTDKNKLIDEISHSFFEQFKNTKDKEAFIKENIKDIQAYTEEVNRIRDEKIEQVKKRTPRYSKDYEEISKQEEIEKINKKFNALNPESSNQIVLKYLNKEKWYTKEFSELLKPENVPLLAFYKEVQKLNEIAYESGYIDYSEKRNFLPFAQKGLFEKMATNGWDIFSAPKDFISSLNSSTMGGTDYSKITGEPVSKLSKPFTSNIAEKFDKDGNKTVDYSILSKELGKSVIAYAQAMYKYQAMSSIDQQINLILSVEKLKDRINTDRWGNSIIKTDPAGNKYADVVPGNEENAKTLYDFVQYLIYGNRYPLSQDTNIGLNRIFGTRFKKNDTPTSMIKTIDAINRGFSIKTLGGNPISGLVNWFGANIQAAAQRNNYFTFKEFVKSQGNLTRMLQMSEKEGDKFVELVKLFNPFTENHNYELFRKASTRVLGRINLADAAMVFMRKGEMQVQAAVFDALTKNMMVKDGKIVNITDYVKSQYPDRYNTPTELKEANAKIDREIEELKKTKSIDATAEYKDGKLLIDGKEFTNKEEIQKLAILSKALYRRITGNVSDSSINQAKLDIFTSSMMVFKNWIPKLWYTRFGALEARNDPFNRDAYDIGRVKLLFNVLALKVGDTKGALINILKGNEKGIESLDALYEKYVDEYRLKTGEEFKMDRAEFNDMIIQNLSNQMRELGILISLMAAMFALGFIKPPDDDKRGKAFIRTTTRIFDQFEQELSFFYNPINIQSTLSRGIFPALGFLKQLEQFTSHTFKEVTGFDLSNPTMSSEDVRKKAFPIKFGLKLFPVASAWEQYISILSPDLAKEWNVPLPQDQSGIQ